MRDKARPLFFAIAALAILAMVYAYPCGAQSFARDFTYYQTHETNVLEVVGQPMAFHASATLRKTNAFGSFVATPTFYAPDAFVTGHAYDFVVDQVRIDMDNDGIFDVTPSNIVAPIEWDYSGSGSAPQLRTARIEVRWKAVDLFSDPPYYTYTTTSSFSFTIYPPARVYANGAGSSFVQVYDEEWTTKAPILIVEGIDPLNHSYPIDMYTTPGLKPFLDNYIHPNYEVFLLNFGDGGTDLRINADVVNNALDAIAAMSPHNNVALVGLSMGGVVARYALAKRESMGQSHHVGLYVSFDAPHLNANINPGLQADIKASDPSNPLIAALQATLKSRAAKILLLDDTYEHSHAARDSFAIEMAQLNANSDVPGFPRSSYNVAVSNGNWRSTKGWESTNDHLLEFQIITNGGAPSPPISESATQLDCGPGSLYTNLAQTTTGSLVYISPPFIDLLWHLSIDYTLTVDFDPVFVPTWSALAVPTETLHPNAVSGSLDLAGQHGSSPFDESVVQDTVHMHSELGGKSAGNLLSWLEATSQLTIHFELPYGGSLADQVLTIKKVRGSPFAVPTAPVVVNGSTITYIFDHWDDGSTENPRYFASGRSVTRTAVMKAVRLTTSSGEAWTTNQRRVAQAYENGGYPYTTTGTADHAVYESGGTIWYVRRFNNESWDVDRPLSGCGVGATAPCVATEADQYFGLSHVAAAWLEPGGRLMYRPSTRGGLPYYYGDDGATWEAPRQLAVGAEDPIAVVLPNMTSIVWAEGPGSSTRGIYYFGSPQTQSSGTRYLIPGTAGNVSQPTCVNGDLAFVRDGHVWATSFYGNVPTTLYSAVDLTGSLPSGWTAANPSCAGGVYLAWEETNGTTSRIAFRERLSGGSWSATTYFSHLSHAAAKPSLSVDLGCGTYGKLKLLWQCGGHVALVTRSTNGTLWTPVMDLGNGRAPSVAAIMHIRPAAMWVSGTTAPYAVNLSSNLPCDENVPPERITTLALDEVSGTTMLISWTAPGDDDNVGTATSYDIRYRTAPITDDNVFEMSTPWPYPPTPQPAGSFQQCQITGLQTCTHYYFAIKAIDDVGNKSLMSYTTGTHTLCNGGGGYGEGRIALGSARGVGVESEADSALSIRWTPSGPGGTLRADRVPVDGEVAAKLTEAGGTFLVLDPNSGANGRHWREMGGDVGIRLVGGTARSYLVPLSSQLSGVATSTSILNGGSGTALSATGASYGSAGDVLGLLSGGWVPDFASGDALEVTYGGNAGLSEDGEDWIVRLNVPLADHGEQPEIGASAPRAEPTTAAEREMLSSNPSRGPVAFAVMLHQPTNAAVTVLDVTGRLVRETSIGVLSGGRHVIRWDGKDENGTQVRSGVYFVYLKGSDLAPKRVVIAR